MVHQLHLRLSQVACVIALEERTQYTHRLTQTCAQCLHSQTHTLIHDVCTHTSTHAQKGSAASSQQPAETDSHTEGGPTPMDTSTTSGEANAEEAALKERRASAAGAGVSAGGGGVDDSLDAFMSSMAVQLDDDKVRGGSYSL